MVNVGKPIGALCVSPIVVAKALENYSIHAKMTIGSDQEKSPYDINAFFQGMESIGIRSEMKTIREILIDTENKIITAPCYMMDASILEVRDNISKAFEALKQLL